MSINNNDMGINNMGVNLDIDEQHYPKNNMKVAR